MVIIGSLKPMTSYTNLGAKNVNILSLDRPHIITFYPMFIPYYPMHVNPKNCTVTYIIPMKDLIDVEVMTVQESTERCYK